MTCPARAPCVVLQPESQLAFSFSFPILPSRQIDREGQNSDPRHIGPHERISESGRVPAVYLASAFLWFFSVLSFRRISKYTVSMPPEGFDSNPGSPQILEAHRSYVWRHDVPQPRLWTMTTTCPKCRAVSMGRRNTR